MLAFKREDYTLNKVILMVLLIGLVVLSFSVSFIILASIFSISHCHEVSTVAELVVTLNSVRWSKAAM